jgi:predicted O-methyltransferase YrrM
MAETIRSVCYSDVVYRGELYRRSLPVYIEMVNLARHVGCQRILELGAGLSTGLWARYADQTGAEVTSVCSEFAPTRSYLAETPEAERLDRCVHCIEGFTVTADQMERFYNAGSQDSLAGISAEEIAAALRLFSSPVSSGRPNRRTDWLTREFGGSAMASDILISDKRLVFTPAVLDAYSEGLRYENELDMLRQAESHGRAGVLDDLPGEWDFVFFDSGELSTIVEWTLLRDRVTPGGFVAFHDIYFPKSIKSCVACSAVVADPEWDVVFVDDTTPQGLLIARRGDLPSCGESR